ncbi:MAG: hypothetical protein ACFFG0_27295, partial [Candidatus Thorarchaeota archaeon]
IPWKVNRGKYIIPEIDSDIWHQAVDGKKVIITAFGGVFESFFSLSVAEAISSYNPEQEIQFLGNDEFSFFARMQGICKLSPINLTKEVLKDYPTPLFFDKNNNVYFNVLNNYGTKFSYWGKYPEENTSPATEQIFCNAMVPWRNYIPNLRKLDLGFYKEIQQSGRISSKSRIILIVLNTTKNDCLNWGIQNLKEFAQLAYHKKFKVIVFTPNTGLFYGTNMLVYDYDIRKIIQIMGKSWAVLSNDINWLLIGLVLTNSHIIGKYMENMYDLYKNAEFLRAENDIFTDRNWISPIDAISICEGLL